MKILSIGTLPGRGGIQSHTRFFLKAMDELGHEVLCINTFNSIELNASYEEQFGFNYSRNIKIVDVAKLSYINKYRKFCQALKDFSPDILINTGHGVLNLVAALNCPKNIPSVYFEVMVGDKLLKIMDPRRHYKRVYDYFIAQSPTVGKKLQVELGKKIHYSSLCAFPHIHESYAPLPIVSERSYEKGKLKACYFGRLVKYKRPQLLLEEFEKVSDLIGEYHIHGSGPHEGEIGELINEKKLKNKVFLHGRYPEGTAYYNMLKEYDLLVLPTKGLEGTPLVLMESMACGVPYISCDAGGIEDFIFPEKHCCVTTKDSEAFIEGVREIATSLLNDKISRKAIQEKFKKHYSFEALKRNWSDEIERIVSGHQK